MDKERPSGPVCGKDGPLHAPPKGQRHKAIQRRQHNPYVHAERKRQTQWKATTTSLPEAARAHGTFDGRAHSWLLPSAHSELNLWQPIRASALLQFAASDIAWHDGDNERYGPGQSGGPSCNLMDSQVACLNFWCGLATTPRALLAAVLSIEPKARALIPPVPGGPLVEPEWMGLGNPLRERGGARRRGQYATSADLLLAYVDASGARHGLLVESKYSESYAPRDGRFSKRGTDRLGIYRHALDAPWSPIRADVDVGQLMWEPFDQHLRQQLLAAAMVAHRQVEGGFESVRLVHVSPRANRAFHDGVHAPAVAGRDDTVGEAWASVLVDPDAYASVCYEDLFEVAREFAAPGWVVYQGARYGWDRQV